MGFADSEIGPQAKFKKCPNMYHTFLKSSNLALFRTVFRFENVQLEVFFLSFQSSKIRKKFAKSYNNVFAAVNLLRGAVVNAKILHVVINAGLVGHKASHQLKYDRRAECAREFFPASNWQNKNSGSKNIAEYLLRPALLGEQISHTVSRRLLQNFQPSVSS